MKCSFALHVLPLVALAVLLAAGATVPSGSASHGTCTVTPSVTAGCHFTSPAKALIGNPAWAPATTATPPGGATWSTSVRVMEKARRAALITPGLSTYGAIAITTAGLYTAAWKMEIPGQGFIYRLVSGEQYGGSTTGITPEWAWMSSGFLSGTPSSPDRYVLVKDAGFVQQAYCGSGGNGFVNAAFTTLARAASGTAELSSLGDASWGCGSANTYQKTRTDAQMQDHVDTEPMTAGEYSAFSGTKRDTGTFTPNEPDASEWEDAEAKFGLDTGTFTLAQETMLAMLNGEIDPDWIPDEFEGTATLPEPGVNETYSEYLVRLQAGGWVGTSTVTVLEDADTALGPHAVVRVRYDTGSGTETVQRPWPSPAPELPANDTAIRLIVNPPTAPVVIPDPITGEDCDCPPVDFGPLEVGASSKFPFGGFTWLHGFVDDTMTTAGGEMPSWTFTKPNSEETVTVNIPDNEYRSITDPLAKIVIVVGSVWFAFAFVTNWRRGETEE